MTAKQPRSRGMARAERKTFFRLMTFYLATVPKHVPPAPTPPGDDEIFFHTPLGPLRLTVREGGGDSVWVFGRFEHAAAAAAVLGEDDVNPYSGKWNCGYGKGWTGYEAYDHFRTKLNRVLALRLEADPAKPADLQAGGD